MMKKIFNIIMVLIFFSKGLFAQDYLLIEFQPNFDRHFVYVFFSSKFSEKEIEKTYNRIGNTYYYKVPDTIYKELQKFVIDNNSHFVLKTDNVKEREARSFSIKLFSPEQILEYDIKVEENRDYFSKVINTLCLDEKSRGCDKMEDFRDADFSKCRNCKEW